MKKQLIIATIACAVSGAAFAATEGSHTINLYATPVVPEFRLNGSAVTGTTQTDLSFDQLSSIHDTITKSMGTIGMSATGYPTTFTGVCELSADSDWELESAGLDPIKYEIKSSNLPPAFGSDKYLEYGYFDQSDNMPADHPLVISVGTGGSLSGGCNLPDTELAITIRGVTRPVVPALTHYTDTITFIARVI